MGLTKGVPAATLCQLGNLSWMLGRPLTWDCAAGQFPGDEQANRLRGRLGRGEWRL